MFGALKSVVGIAALSTALGAGPVAVYGPQQQGQSTARPANHGWFAGQERGGQEQTRFAGADRRGDHDRRADRNFRGRFDVDFDVEFDARGDGDGVRIELFGSSHDRHDAFACRPREVVPFALDLDAYQSGDEVVLIARGQNRTSGFLTTLERVKHRGRTVVALRNIAPDRHAICAQVQTGFEIAGTLSARGCVENVTVFVAGQERCIKVRQLNSIPRAW